MPRVSRRGSRALALGVLVLAAGAVALVVLEADPGGPSSTPTVQASAGRPVAFNESLIPRSHRPPPAYAIPSSDAIAAATAWLAQRAGHTAFACVDPTGALHGVRIHDRFHSASLVKAMLLTAYLRDVAADGRSPTATDQALLDPMIRYSDNDAASAIFGLVGESGLQQLALEAGMTDFSTSPAWGYTEVSAADQARFFAQLGRLLPRGSAPLARSLLGGITPMQRWGIPAAAEPLGWHVYFKGGWLEGIVNQAARLERGRTTISIAVLTDENPSMGYGIETIEGVTARLLEGET